MLFLSLTHQPEETVSSALVFGSGIHAAAEQWFNELMMGNPAPDHDTLLAAFWHSWQGRNDELPIRYNKNEDINSIGQLADRVLTAFRQSEFANPKGTIIAIEEELRGELVPGVPDLLGIVDLIVECVNTMLAGVKYDYGHHSKTPAISPCLIAAIQVARIHEIQWT